MKKNFASIDIGTHTARLLVAEKSNSPAVFRPMLKKRFYIRLADGYDALGDKIIQAGAIDRTQRAIKDFSSYIKEFNVYSTYAVATGVVRESSNKDEFLSRVYEYTGIRARPISGNEEAVLTAKGVSSALDIQDRPFLMFDLGGGSTEFLFSDGNASSVRSLPLGASVLTERFIISDPPLETQTDSMSRYIDQCLKHVNLVPKGGQGQLLVVATGGTVTTLAAMAHKIDWKKISTDMPNGLILKREEIESLFDKITRFGLEDRVRVCGIEKERAEVILAGFIIVARIMHFFGASQLTVSLFDLLEGILIEYFEGE